MVGAGPTGLVLAADLPARGVATRIVDKGDGVNLETRAIAIHARALEVLDLMGRENVIASAVCGFSSQATYRPEVDPRVMWAKFDAMQDGSALASERLWP